MSYLKKNIIEDDNFLSERNKIFIESIFDIQLFPFYFYKGTEKNKRGDSFLSHCLLRREEERDEAEYGNSPFLKEALLIFESFVDKHKIKYKKLLRASINFSYNNGFEASTYHNDHTFNHKQLLVYLNDCDKDAETWIKKDNKIIKITPEKYKGVLFDNCLHKFKFPKTRERVVLIVTFTV
jgi:hypothetical protein